MTATSEKMGLKAGEPSQELRPGRKNNSKLADLSQWKVLTRNIYCTVLK